MVRQSSVAGEGGANGYAFGSVGYAWFVVGVLCALQVVSNMERQVLSLTVEPLRRDFGIGDVEVSLLQGIAFALFYAVAAVPIGWLADRWRRDRIIMLGMLLWVTATIGCMVARSFSALFAARLLTGLADASLLPAAFSLLSDYFPRDKVAAALGAVTGASFLGTGISLTFGGYLLSILPVDGYVALPLVGSVHGWQLAFGIIGLPAVGLFGLLFALREPPRRRGEDDDGDLAAPSPRDVARYVAGHRGYFVGLLGGVILLSAYQYGLSSWTVTLFIRTYGWSATDIGLLYGLLFMTIAPTASLLGGRICDGLRARGRADANFLIAVGAIVVVVPLSVVLPLSGSAMLSAIALGLVTFSVILAFGPAMAAIPVLVPSAMRAQLVAMAMLLATLFGAGGGPWIVALITEKVFGTPDALAYSMALCGPLLLIPALALFESGRRAAARYAV